ncbi:MAG TPA: alcohol dehydrogenase catalytic domain-containing protein [Candidatus Thermoplasmatota archaeon]|nr:alcohol dehydrogenase catalytic domain-containing protein [Candidatus Thermoplasmatota archaeon]
MRAVVYKGRKDVRVEERPDPRVEAPDDAVVRVTRAAICGSDLHLYHYSLPSALAGDVVLGHEQVGVVEEVGPAVRGLRVGQRVVVSGLIADGTCWYCRRGLFSQCQGTNRNELQRRAHGQYHAALLGFGKQAGGYGGGQAERLRVPHADVNCLPLPDRVDDDAAVFLSDVLNVAWMGNDIAATGPDTSVAVWGCGPVGLNALACAKARGVRQLFAIDHHEDRLELARRATGATPIHFEQEDVHEALLALTDERGPDVGIDCTGFRFSHGARHTAQRLTGLETDSGEALAEMMRCVRGGGAISIVGFYLGFTNQFPTGALMQKDLTLRGAAVNVQRYWKELLALVEAGELDPRFTITHRFPLEEAAEAYKLYDGRGAVKVLLEP